jgi:hypothetical protein
MKLGTVPPLDVHDWLEAELRDGVPRNLMGKSIFGLDHKIYRYLFRVFDLSGELRLYNEDIINAQATILCSSAVAEGHNLAVEVPFIHRCFTDRRGAGGSSEFKFKFNFLVGGPSKDSNHSNHSNHAA